MSICDNCHSGCCRAFAVPVSGADIIRLERDTGQTFWDFACRWADPDGEISRKYAPHFYFADEPETPFTICLTHVDSESFPGTTKCVFLKETKPSREHPLGTGLCSVYGSRPSACRCFPTKMNSTGELAVLYDVPQPERSTLHSAYSLCPRPWTKEDVDSVDALPHLVVAQFEMKFFHTVAQIWNERKGPWMVFPEFLRNVYSRRVLDQQTPNSLQAPKAA